MFTRPWDEQWERFRDLVKMVSDSSLEPQHVASQALSGTRPWGWLRAGEGHGTARRSKWGEIYTLLNMAK